MKPLWEDEDRVFEDRYEKSASALIAVAQTLEKEKPLSGNEQEFLDLYQLALAADPENFTKVWVDPSSYFWVRVAYELLGSCLSGDPLPTRAREYCEALEFNSPKKALDYHLHTFKSFILGIHFLEDIDAYFATPLILDLPYSIPGTLYSLEGEGQVEISKLVSGNLIGSYSAQPLEIMLDPGASCASGKISVSKCPVVTLSGCEIILKPQTFNNLPSLGQIRPTIDAGLQYQKDQENLIKECLEIINQYHPDSFHHFQKNTIWVGLKTLSAGTYSNITFSELPLSFMASVINNPFEMADAFIHEFHHNRLFFIEENGAFLEDSKTNSSTNEIYYSPWRNDNRALQGILHAVYVYIPVTEFWINVVEAGKASEQELAYARSQWLSGYLRLTIGLFQLKRLGSFTALGQKFFSRLGSAVEEIGEKIRRSHLTFDLISMICMENGDLLPRTSEKTKRQLNVSDHVLEHLEKYSPKEQKINILREKIINDLQQFVTKH
jgi:hypothetical protein